MASAQLLLPDGSLRFVGGFRRAALILHFEPPAGSDKVPLPAGPVAWTDHITRALELPNALNRLLSDQLGALDVGEPAGSGILA